MTLRTGNRLWSGSEEHTVGDLADRFALPSPAAGWEGPVAYAGSMELDLIAAAAWAAREGRETVILPRDRLTPTTRDLLSRAGYGIVSGEAVVLPPTERRRATRPKSVGVLTSGTTGPPKLLEHTWESLWTFRPEPGSRTQRWLLTYQGGTYAWYQMITMALFVPGQDLVICESREPLDLLEAAEDGGATAISSTPTFWRIVLFRAQGKAVTLPLSQITLGGERVDQDLLDQLRRLFPRARLTHIYASTEAGACLIVNDGRAGFPRLWLEDEEPSDAGPPDALPSRVDAETPPPLRTRLRVRNGRLWVSSPHAAVGVEGFIDTGDEVISRDDRVVVVGRAGESIINVGGLKASGAEIEDALLLHPAVAWCRVFPRSAPLVGQVVAADVVLAPESLAESSRETVLTVHLRTRLPDHAVPRLWRFLNEIPTTDALKTTRAKEES